MDQRNGQFHSVLEMNDVGFPGMNEPLERIIEPRVPILPLRDPGIPGMPKIAIHWMRISVGGKEFSEWTVKKTASPGHHCHGMSFR